VSYILCFWSALHIPVTLSAPQHCITSEFHRDNHVTPLLLPHHHSNHATIQATWLSFDHVGIQIRLNSLSPYLTLPYSMFYFWSFPWTFLGPSLLLSSNIPYPFQFHYFLCSFLFSYKLISIKSLYFINFKNKKKFPTSPLWVQVPLSLIKFSSSFLTLSKSLYCVLTSHVSIFNHITLPVSSYYVTTASQSSSLCLSSIS